ncbi:tryptophan 7-halogenase [Streptomyces sp. NPDC057271]|uniref:tryptophan 7-halogenase n=2 Tax=unclassified Streptomyces TaxID=2593676 RepID=UPI00362B1502
MLCKATFSLDTGDLMGAIAEEFDAVVVGGGPGGSASAALITKQGHRVLLLEKEVFPRYQIGESLLPSTVHGIGRLLGITEELEKAGFVRKTGGTFRWGTNPEPWTFAFSVSPRMAGPTSFAYEVERMKFDKILSDNARRLGADVRENSTVTEVLSDDERVVGVRWTDVDGNVREARATFVIDASGNTSRISGSGGGAASTRISSATWPSSATSRAVGACRSPGRATSCPPRSTAAGSGTSR